MAENKIKFTSILSSFSDICQYEAQREEKLVGTYNGRKNDWRN